MTKTDQFVRTLLLNGFRPYRQGRKRAFEKNGDRIHTSFTLLGAGWVHVYQREYPCSEGWSIYNCRVSKAQELIRWC
jgi:hypothetical protein